MNSIKIYQYKNETLLINFIKYLKIFFFYYRAFTIVKYCDIKIMHGIYIKIAIFVSNKYMKRILIYPRSLPN